MNLVVRTAGDPRAIASAVRSELRAVDPELPVYQVRTMEDRVSESLAPRRFALVLLGAFALLALALSAIGLYGVLSYLAGQGTREIGIRMALGASQRGVLTLVLRRGMSLALAGLGAGILAAWPLARLLRGLLFGVRESDAVTFACSALGLAVVAFVACYVPARRAARVDPLVVLRME